MLCQKTLQSCFFKNRCTYISVFDYIYTSYVNPPNKMVLKADYVVGFLLILGIFSLPLILLKSFPKTDTMVKCGDPYIAEERHESATIINIAVTTTGFIIVASIITFMESPKNKKTMLPRLLAFTIASTLITIAIATFASHRAGELSPHFLKSCNPEPDREAQCAEAFKHGKNRILLSCQTTEDLLMAARSASHPTTVALAAVYNTFFLVWIYKTDLKSDAKKFFKVVLAAGIQHAVKYVIVMTNEANESQAESAAWLGAKIGTVAICMFYLLYPQFSGKSEKVPEPNAPVSNLVSAVRNVGNTFDTQRVDQSYPFNVLVDPRIRQGENLEPKRQWFFQPFLKKMFKKAKEFFETKKREPIYSDVQLKKAVDGLINWSTKTENGLPELISWIATLEDMVKYLQNDNIRLNNELRLLKGE